MPDALLRIPSLQIVRAIPLIAQCYKTNVRSLYEEVSGVVATVDGVEKIEKERVVAICGTDTLDDVIAALWVKMGPATLTQRTAASNAKIHAGFLHTFHMACDDLVMQCLAADRLTIVGHSMGGALACMAAYVLVTEYRMPLERVKVVTLGTPRMGNGTWARMYRDAVPQTWRIATAADPITRLPPPWGWRHVGEGIRLRTDGTRTHDGWAIVLHLMYAIRCKLDIYGHDLSDYSRVIESAILRGTI